MDKKAPKQIHRFKKGDAFIELTPDSLIFMEINDVEDSTENMFFCIVTWYMINEKGLNRWQPAMASSAILNQSNEDSLKRLKELCANMIHLLSS